MPATTERTLQLRAELQGIQMVKAARLGLLHDSKLARRERVIRFELDHGEPAPKRQQNSNHWHVFEAGDLVSHAQYGDGEVIEQFYSSKLRRTLYTVRYGAEVHTSMAGDLTPREPQP